jgi:hypothetical protein
MTGFLPEFWVGFALQRVIQRVFLRSLYPAMSIH